jgi:hypothetical protein
VILPKNLYTYDWLDYFNVFNIDLSIKHFLKGYKLNRYREARKERKFTSTYQAERFNELFSNLKEEEPALREGFGE